MKEKYASIKVDKTVETITSGFILALKEFLPGEVNTSKVASFVDISFLANLGCMREEQEY